MASLKYNKVKIIKQQHFNALTVLCNGQQVKVKVKVSKCVLSRDDVHSQLQEQQIPTTHDATQDSEYNVPPCIM